MPDNRYVSVGLYSSRQQAECEGSRGKLVLMKFGVGGLKKGLNGKRYETAERLCKESEFLRLWVMSVGLRRVRVDKVQGSGVQIRLRNA